MAMMHGDEVFTELAFAVNTNDTENANRLAKEGHIVPNKIAEKITRKGMCEVVKVFLSKGGDPHIYRHSDAGRYKSSLLSLAVEEDHVEVARVLLQWAEKHHVDLLHLEQENQRPLLKALRKRIDDMVNLLLQFGDLSDQLIAAVHNDDHDAVEEISIIAETYGQIHLDNITIQQAASKGMMPVIRLFFLWIEK